MYRDMCLIKHRNNLTFNFTYKYCSKARINLEKVEMFLACIQEMAAPDVGR
jgi:hypothetical protein